MSTSATLADFTSESKWRSLPMWQAVSRSLVFHSCVWTTIAMLSFRAIVTPGFDRHAILIEFDSRYPETSPAIARTVPVTGSPMMAPLSNPLLNPTENAVPKPVQTASTNRLLPSASLFKPPLITSTSNRKGPVVTVQRPPRPNPAIAVHNPKAPDQATPAAVTASAPQPAEVSAGPTSKPVEVESPKGIGASSVGSTPFLHPKGSRPYMFPISAGMRSPGSVGMLTTALPRSVSGGTDPPVAITGVNTAGTVRINNLAGIGVPLGRSTFAALDAEACRIFYHGEAIAKDKPDEARDCYRKAIKIMNEAIPLLQSEVGPEHTEMAFALFNVGRCYHHLQEYGTAANYFRQAEGMYGRMQGAHSQTRGNALVWLADTLIEQGKDSEAEEYLVESLPIYQKCFGEKHEWVAHTYNRLAGICERADRRKEAKSYREKAKSILATGKISDKN